jgi:hypothetical protein
MTDIIRHCPDCGSDHALGQHHGIAGWCPDTADLYCPEWYCQDCGAALLIGDIPASRRSAAGPAAGQHPAIRARVA